MIITLYFNPAYDGGVWVSDPKSGSACFGSKLVGALGLLQELELRLGISAPEKGFHELLSAFHNAAIDTSRDFPDVFFADSLKLAPLKTPAELLKWRDELVLSGWKGGITLPDGLTDGAQTILSDMEHLEENLPPSFQTLSDRWIAVLEMLKKGSAPRGIHLVLSIDRSHMHPLYKNIIDALKDNGIPVEEAKTDTHRPEVIIKHFKDSVDACWWTASTAKDELIVCDDTHTLDAALAGLGRPLAGSKSPASLRPIEHLLSSALMLLADAYDIEAMRDYLSSPYHPLNDFKLEDGETTLRKQLLFHLISQDGFGENERTHRSFQNIIDEFSKADKTINEEIRRFLPEGNKPITFARIKALCRSLSSWATGYLDVSADREMPITVTEQLRALIDFCKSMEFVCKETGFDNRSAISKEELLGALRSIYIPEALPDSLATVGSVSVVSGIEGIASEISKAIWVAPSNNKVPQPLSFLCESDVKVLAKIIPYVWTRDNALLFADDAFNVGLSRIGQLTVLYCDRIRGAKPEKHSFLLRHKEKMENLKYEDIPESYATSVSLRPANTLQDQYTFNGKQVTIPSFESPSSLEKMFDCPFDWAVQKVLGLYDERDNTLSTIEGIVAHRIIHRICEIASGEGKIDVSHYDFEKVFKDKYGFLFDEAITDCGAELMLPENRIECSQLRTILKERSIPTLIDILKNSGLVIVGSELPFSNVDLSNSNNKPLVLTGTIDLLTRNADGGYVIVDFKWAGSTGRNLRSRQIERGEDYQLALYRRVLEKGRGYNVTAQAFYMLRTAELLTAYPGFKDKNGEIATVRVGRNTHQKAYSETLTDIFTRYSETVRALGNGTVDRINLKYETNQILKGNLK